VLRARSAVRSHPGWVIPYAFLMVAGALLMLLLWAAWQPEGMETYLIVPFDGSPAAQAVLQRAADAAHECGRYPHLLVATVGVGPQVLADALADARVRAGAQAAVTAQYLRPSDPIGALHARIAALPDVTVVAPIGERGSAPWYAQACQLGGLDVAMMLFSLRPSEHGGQAVPAAVHTQHRLAHRLPAPLRALTRRLSGHGEPQVPAC
jgi:hypothetical protein